jgi:hypothetical protein
MIYCMVCALWQTEEKIPDRQTASKDDKYKGFTSIMAGLCGRGKDKFGKEKNTLKELGRVAVHYFVVSVHTYMRIYKCMYVCMCGHRLYDIAPAGHARGDQFQYNNQPLCAHSRRRRQAYIHSISYIQISLTISTREIS